MKYIQSDEIANIIKNNYYQSKLLAQYPKLLHGFGSRENGIPPTQDKSDMLETFHQKIANKFKISLNNIICLEQIHSKNVEIIEQGSILKATDGVITSKSNLLLCIRTADCAPIFIFDHYKNVIAALHGGWRGVARNIIANAINLMKSHFNVNPKQLIAAVGPSLKSCCFEIGPEILHLFDNRFILNKAGKYYLRFAQLILAKLQQAGIVPQNIDMLEHCTKCNNDIFYSYRGDNQETGRMLNVIGMEIVE